MIVFKTSKRHKKSAAEGGRLLRPFFRLLYNHFLRVQNKIYTYWAYLMEQILFEAQLCSEIAVFKEKSNFWFIYHSTLAPSLFCYRIASIHGFQSCSEALGTQIASESDLKAIWEPPEGLLRASWEDRRADWRADRRADGGADSPAPSKVYSAKIYLYLYLNSSQNGIKKITW